MADISLYTAAIAGAAAVSGAAIPTVTALIREAGQAKRSRARQAARERTQACLDLLSAAQELRTKIANAAYYHGPEMGSRLEAIRACAAAVQFNATRVALLTGQETRRLADRLYDTADTLSARVIESTNMAAGEMDPKPDLDTLTQEIGRFRNRISGSITIDDR